MRTTITGSCVLREGRAVFRHPSNSGRDLHKRNYFRGWRWIPDLKFVILMSQCFSVSHYVVVSRTFLGSPGICRVCAPIPGKERAVAAAFKVDCRSFESFRSSRYPGRGLCAMDNCSRIPGRPWVAPQRGCTYSDHITKTKTISLANYPSWSSALVPKQCYTWGYHSGGPCQEVACPPGR